jgi:hypothetical protein
MLDLYGSYTPHTLHTRPPTCLPTAQPRTTSLSPFELASLVVPSLLLLLALALFMRNSAARPKSLHIYYKAPPPPPPTPTFSPQLIYNIQAWGGEETPIIWATDHYPQVTFPISPSKSHETPDITETKED